MAFGNGVLMRAGAHWAWARDDGSVLHGLVPVLLSGRRWARLPLLRSLAAFLEMIALTVRLHGRNGRRRWVRLLLWLAVMVAVSVPLGLVLESLIHPQVLADLVVQAAGLVLALVVLQFGMGTEVWRFHGAEHKAVNAYEAGDDLTSTDSVGAFSRIHDRCGTNLVALVAVFALLAVPIGYGPAGQVLSLAAGLLGVAAALELFRLVQRRPRSLVSRGVLAVGRTLQRLLTTREPRPEHLALACVALRRVLELESGEARAELAA